MKTFPNPELTVVCSAYMRRFFIIPYCYLDKINLFKSLFSPCRCTCTPTTRSTIRSWRAPLPRAARCARPLVHDGALYQHPRSRRARPSNFRYHPSSSTCRITRTRTRCRTIRTLCHSPCSSTRTRTRTEVSAELFCNSCQILAVCFLFAGFLSATHAYALPMRHPHQPHTHTCFSEPALSPTLKYPHQVSTRAGTGPC